MAINATPRASFPPLTQATTTTKQPTQTHPLHSCPLFVSLCGALRTVNQPTYLPTCHQRSASTSVDAMTASSDSFDCRRS